MNFCTNFKTILRLALCMLIGVISSGCSSQKNSNAITPESKDVSYKYNEKVIPQNKKSISYIKNVKNNSITYDKDTPARFLPKVDDIISSGINDVFPHGIGVKVTGVNTLPNGDIECTTTPAKLDQIFDELKITSRTNLINGENGEVTAIDKDGKEVKLKVVSSSDVSKQRAGYNKNFLFVHPMSFIDFSMGKHRSDLNLEIPFHTEYKINPSDIGISVGDLSFGKTEHYNFDGNVHAGLGLLYDCDIKAKTFKLALDANCGFEISEWLFENEVSKSLELFDYRIINQYIDLGPVVLNVTLHLVLEANTYHSGYFRSQASKDVGVEVGITQNGAYGETYSKGNEEKLIQIDSINAKIGTSLPFHPNVVVGLYDEDFLNGKIEPTIRFGLETNCRLEDENIFKISPTMKLYSNGSVGASVNFFEGGKISLSKSGETAPFSIWEKGWPLLPVLDPKSVAIIPKKSGEKYIMSFNFSSDGIIQKWKDNMMVGAIITTEDSLIQRQPAGKGNIISAKQNYKYTFDNLSLEMYKSYMARPEIVWNGRIYNTNGIAFAVNGVTFNTKDYYIKSVKYFDAYSDEDYGCDFWDRDHYHYYHDLIFEVDGSDRCAEIGNQCTTDDWHKELSLSLHDGILKGQYVFLTTSKVSSFMVETVPYAYMLNGERLTFEPYQFRLWRDESIINEWYK